ncbi:hypothetical protein [Pseudodesulfovibrio portus]|uniref:hypothetical protein n=1 Tax=Pseudodesulfovibrio portus TaxID=231439 RepID=UPI00222FB024|nr:hypothetical protein [Pseudodesulfovibrio portus]
MKTITVKTENNSRVISVMQLDLPSRVLAIAVQVLDEQTENQCYWVEIFDVDRLPPEQHEQVCSFCFDTEREAKDCAAKLASCADFMV